MRRYYCTLFDKYYLYQGLALHSSLTATTDNFILYALAMDEETFIVLSKLNYESLIPIRVDDLLTDEIRGARENTSHGQFCWVNQPLICRYLLDHHGLEMVTYLESDSFFFSDPEVLFEELGESSVSLVPHNFSSEFDNSDVAGRFCVQFNAFRNDGRARSVLADWIKANLSYSKLRPNFYPGQKCIDVWPEKFLGIKVLKNKGAGVAPWNIRGYLLSKSNGIPLVDGVPVVFYHYHQYGRLNNGEHELGSYPMTSQVVDTFYRPYVSALRRAELEVKKIDPSFSFRRVYANSPAFYDLLMAPSKDLFISFLTKMKRKLRGRFNIFTDEFFSDNPDSKMKKS
jgi:hypothetical protein